MELKPYKKKALKVVFFIFAFLIATIGGGFYGYLLWSRPNYDGEINISAIKTSVSITRDNEGVPHIAAENENDAYFALGYTMAQDRLFQMEISRRAASGELSEIIGDKTLLSDKTFRNLKLRKSALEMLAKNPIQKKNPVMYELISSFYKGVNYYQDNNPLPIEFKILGIKPRPFSIEDAYTFIGLMSFNFAIALNQDPLLTKLEQRLGAEYVNDLRVEKINSKQKLITNIKSQIYDHSKISGLISYLETGYPLYDGSNGWLLSKKRTSTKSTMLANDPHISYPHPGIWYEAHVKTPTFETYGHFLPLLPFPILSHNSQKAWGLTMTLTDDMDLFQEKLIEDGSKYIYKNNKLPLKTSLERIKIKGREDYQFTLKETQHGPILDEILSDKGLALSWAFHDIDNDPISVLYKMSYAKNMTEFKQAVSEGIAPGLNVLYADSDNIAWWMFGKIALKPKQMRSDFILDGSSGKDEYSGFMKFEDKPHSENPESGIIVSANFRPFGFPADLRGDWQPDDRFNTIYTLLSKKERWSIEETEELQTLSLNLDNKAMLNELLLDLKRHPINQEYIEDLASWNLVSDKNSRAPLIYYTFQNRVARKLLKDLSEEELETYAKISTSYIFLKRVILDRDSVWWKKYDRKKIVAEAFDETINLLKEKYGNNDKNWKWGNAHTIEFSHPLGKIKPLNYIFNIGPYPIDGASQDINNQKSDSLKDQFLVKAGPSTRRIITFDGIENEKGILPVGQSGHLLSPFYKNQLERFINGKYRNMLTSNEAIKKDKSHLLRLSPIKN
jgi:penicillin amidase